MPNLIASATVVLIALAMTLPFNKTCGKIIFSKLLNIKNVKSIEEQRPISKSNSDVRVASLRSKLFVSILVMFKR
jgi:hypothetical protein